MAYDSQTYGTSPFGSTAKGKTARPTTSEPTRPANSRTTTTTTLTASATPISAGHPEALSDQLTTPEDIPANADSMGQNTEPPVEPDNGLPALPEHQSPALRAKQKGFSLYRIPEGRTGLNLVGEALGWLMAWGTVGFFRAYVPEPVLMVCDRFFSPWGMTGMTLTAALLIGQLLTRYQLKIGTVRTLATTAIEYGQANHRADAQEKIFNLLTQAEDHSKTASRWIVSWLTALGCLFIIGAFY